MPMYQVVRTPGGGAWVRETDAVQVGAGVVADAAVGGAIAAARFVAQKVNYRKHDQAWSAILKAQKDGDMALMYELSKEFARHYPQEQGGWGALTFASTGLELPLDEALEVARMLDEHGERGSAACVRATAYLLREDVASALPECNTLVGCEGEDKVYGHLFRARVMLWLGDLDQALNDATTAVAMLPDEDSYSMRAEVFWVRGDLARAVADYTASLRLDSAQPRRLESRASVYEEQGLTEAAEADRQAARVLRGQVEPVSSPAVAAAAAGPQSTAPVSGPTHLVPQSGMPFWTKPDGSQPPSGHLPAWVELVVDSHEGAWAYVRASNGWQGWVDGRLLVPRR